MNGQHRFQPGQRGKVWVGDVLFTHTRRVKGRGWLYRGQHHLGVVSLTVEDIRESLRPKPNQMIRLGSVIHTVRFFGVVPDGSPDEMAATLEMVGDGAVLTLPTLTGPPGPGGDW